MIIKETGERSVGGFLSGQLMEMERTGKTVTTNSFLRLLSIIKLVLGKTCAEYKL